MKSNLELELPAQDSDSLLPETGDFAGGKQRLLEECRVYLDQQIAAVRKLHRDGTSGTRVTRALTEVFDRLNRRIFTLAAADLGAEADGKCALLALGGYGRSEMSPRSDLDLMFYYTDSGQAVAQQISDRMLYLLWDLNLDVGYSVRSAGDCLEQAAHDITVRTALLDARHLAGSSLAWEEFNTRVMKKYVLGNSPQAFVKAKLIENQERRKKYGSSVYLLEPNIKEGEGGLRDLHAALWIARIKFKAASLRDLVIKGVLNEGEAEAEYTSEIMSNI